MGIASRIVVALAGLHLMLGRTMAFAVPVLSNVGRMRHPCKCAGQAQDAPRPQHVSRWMKHGALMAIMPRLTEPEDFRLLPMAYIASSPVLAMFAVSVRRAMHRQQQGSAVASSPKQRRKSVDQHHKFLNKAALHSSSVACSMYFHFLREGDQIHLPGQPDLADPRPGRAHQDENASSSGIDHASHVRQHRQEAKPANRSDRQSHSRTVTLAR
jgi:hypothetical protein